MKIPCASFGVVALFGAAALGGNSGSPSPAVLPSSLSSVRILPPAVQSSVVALPFNSPPINGFVPQVVFGLTPEDSSDDFDWYSHASSAAGGTSLPSAGSPKYFVATYDTGSQSHIVTTAASNVFNINGAGLQGDPNTPQTIIGANGTETGTATDALGIYATGFQNVTGTGGGNISVAAGSLLGQYNTSVIVLDDPNSALPNIVGAPMTAMYQTIISNSTTRHLTVGSQTFKSPDVRFVSQGSSTAGYSRLTLSAVPSGDFTDPPSFLPNFDTFDHDNPQTATFWGSLLANVSVTHTGGSSSTQVLFDTGAEISAMSEDTANTLGIFLQGPDATTPDFMVDVTGVGGTVLQKPGFYVNQLKFTTSGGFFTYSHVPIVVIDLPDPRDPLHQTLPGVLGTNLFSDRDLIIDTSGTPAVYFGPQLTPQWNVDSNGNWSDDPKWIMGSPQEVDAPANFLGAATAPRTITVDGNFTVGSMKFDNANRYTIAGTGQLTLQAFVGPASITVASGSHTIAAPMTFASDAIITVTPPASVLTISSDVNAAGRAITKSGAGVLEMKNVRAGSLSVNQGGVRVLAGASPNSSVGVSILQSLSIAPGAALDLTNNSAIINYTALGTLLSDVRGHLQSNRLFTSAGTATRRIGYGDNAVLGKTSFAGQNPGPNSVLIKYTYAGDADLDGDADGVDIGTWATNFTGELGGTGSMVWTQGDWDYDGDVDGVDAGLWAQSFTGELGGAGLGSLMVDDPNIAPAAAAILRGMGITVIPEPAAAGSLLVILIAVSGRRRTRRMAGLS